MPTKFLIVSNGRVGSTWLVTLLGSLSDVYTDYEFKWRPGYKPKPVHYVIPDETFSVGNALSSLSETHPVVGSKLVLDPRPHATEEYKILGETIEPDVRIIHLHRKYEEIVVSWAKPKGAPVKSGRRKFDGSAIQRAINDGSRRGEPGRLSKVLAPAFDVMGTKKVSDMVKALSIRDAYYLAKALATGRLWFPSAPLQERLLVLLTNDIWISKLSARPYYVSVAYDEIPRSLPAIVDFIGSSASAEAIQDALSNPVTEKVVKQPPGELVIDYGRFRRTCDRYEKAKEASLASI